MEVIKAGGDTLDAVIAGVNIVELDPRDTSVGYGGLPNEDGVVELDASCMHGPTRRGGAVGALRGIKTPSKIAQLVMAETDHMMLVGEGALRFAKVYGYQGRGSADRALAHGVAGCGSARCAIRTGTRIGNRASAMPRRRRRSRELKKAVSACGRRAAGRGLEVAVHPPHGTINCIALNEKGEMSAVTTTSGMAWKIPGRVRRFADHRRRALAGPGHRRRRFHRPRRREFESVRRAHRRGKHAARYVAEGGGARRLEACGAKFRQ